MPLGGRKNKGKKPAPMLMVDSGSFNAEVSFAVGASSLTLGKGTSSKTEGKEITFTEHGITYDNHLRALSEENFECWAEGKTTFLGRGAAGMVELMREKRTGDPVAVKHMSMTAKSDRDQTIEEVRSMWKLDHPNVVRFHGAYFCAKDQTVCFVLEYMNSNSLQQILKKCQETPMAEPVVGRLVGDILEGVRYLHSQKIIHRDLKPGNVLCHDNGKDVTVKVADFGIVKTMENAEQQFATTGVGTVAYMSPERLEIDHDVGYTYATDIWAVGLIAGECATGKHLYPSEVQHIQFDFIVHVKDNPTPNVDPEVHSPELISLIDLCLKKEPTERPSAEEMLSHPFVEQTRDVAMAVVKDPRTGLECLEVRLTEAIVRQCIAHYYGLLESEPASLEQMFEGEGSTLTLNRAGGGGEVFSGPREIVARLAAQARECEWVARTVQPQRIDVNHFLCSVNGTFAPRRAEAVVGAGVGAERSFSHVFTLVSSELSLHVRHVLQFVVDDG